MPMIKSHTDEARKKNIEEMIRAGHEPKQAVAAAYANQRKYKKMAEGGEVEDIQDPYRTLGVLQADSQDEESYEHKESMDHHDLPEDDLALARALKKQLEEED